MASWQKPDPSNEFAKLVGRVAELERAVRRGKPAPNVRALGDTDTDATAKVTNGQALVYSESTGKWGPGSAAAGGPSVALFINNNSPWLSSGYHHYDFAESSEADPAWFEWPVGGSDKTRVRLLESGIYAVLATSSGSGGSTHRVLIECGIFGSLGGNYDGTSGDTLVSANGGVAVYPSAIDPSGTDVDVRVYAVGPTNAQGSLTITRWASPYYESFSGNGFVWEEVTY